MPLVALQKEYFNSLDLILNLLIKHVEYLNERL